MARIIPWRDVKPGDKVLLQGGMVEVVSEAGPDPEFPEDIRRINIRLMSNGAEAMFPVFQQLLTAVEGDEN